VRSFYKDLYEKRSTSNEAKKRLLDTIKNSFSSDSKEYKEMKKLFSQEEIFTILKKFPKSKSPGPDGSSANCTQLSKKSSPKF
jgi:hypothetical protein